MAVAWKKLAFATDLPNLAAPGAIGETTPGTIRGLNKEIFITSSRAITAPEMAGTIINNYGMTDSNCAGTLAACSTGMNFVVIVGTERIGRTFKITPKQSPAEVIYLNGTALTAGYSVQLASTTPIGSAISFMAFETTGATWAWFATSIIGSWVAVA